jgi:transposase
MTVLSVSDGELRRLEVLRDVDRGGLPVSAAAQLLGRSERQVWRLLKAFRRDGGAGLISKKRGRPSNRRTAASVRVAVLWVVCQNYADFGPTLATEKLAAEHGFAFSGETLRKWMIDKHQQGALRLAVLEPCIGLRRRRPQVAAPARSRHTRTGLNIMHFGADDRARTGREATITAEARRGCRPLDSELCRSRSPSD